MKRFRILLGIPLLLTACVNGTAPNPQCPDCGNPLQTDQPQASDESNSSVENPVRSLGGSPIGGDAETVADDLPEQPAPAEDPTPSEPTDSEVDALIEDVSFSNEDLEDAMLVPGNPSDPADPHGLGLVDRWGFPLLDQVGPDILLELFIDGLSFGILPPDQPGQQGNPSDFTILERQCIAQGEPEFICRQRYGQ